MSNLKPFAYGRFELIAARTELAGRTLRHSVDKEAKKGKKTFGRRLRVKLRRVRKKMFGLTFSLHR